MTPRKGTEDEEKNKTECLEKWQLFNEICDTPTYRKNAHTLDICLGYPTQDLQFQGKRVSWCAIHSDCRDTSFNLQALRKYSIAKTSEQNCEMKNE